MNRFALEIIRFCTVTFSLTYSTFAAESSGLVIRKDMGGSVEARVVEIKELDRKQTKIEISGTCVSACTLYLGAHNTCVKPNARLGFHGPSSALRGIPLVPREFDRVSMMMADYYPPKIRAWFLAKARYVFEDYITISGRQAIEMGAKPCS